MSFCKIGPNFPKWLKTQRSLKVLLMSMSGILDKAPSWFWNWASNVDTIDLSGNNIEGDDLKSNHLKGQLPHLSANVEMLNIANNSFFGSISTFLCHEVNRRNILEVLDASNNLLSGKLSHCWMYWQSLVYLNLGSNNLSGRIPYLMVSLVGLKALHLHNNSISGDIPSSLQKCSNLTLIDIGENHFPMTIPLWIGKMPSLQILRRSSGFKGHIPLQICQLSYLRVLDLANNSLSSSIPKCLNLIRAMAMLPDYAYGVNLEYFNDVSLYYVSLMLVPKGNVLEYEGNLRFVKTIDLSSNNLSGSIPIEISFLSKLHFLNLSQNHLTGNIPEIYRLQSFDALSYAGNPNLCGAPLSNNCTKERKSNGDNSLGKAEDESETSWFYIGLGVGLALGFWGICGALFFKRTWRHAYFRFVYDMKDQAYVTTVLKVNWICKKFKKLTFW
ncbi:receptor-like protein eix2 [Quercus suber]|uniref:Receptor-like protein eix2 n=1 Tax=Quercus suber TaxID=58331 RepID=A0AAW0MCJ4_QUESU